MNNTTISLAVVEDVADSERNGGFSASITSLGGAVRPVTYVSPYVSNSEGAFIAIPEEGTTILVCKPDENSSWYFLGATFIPEPGQAEGGAIPDGKYVEPVERVLPDLYRSRGVPMQMAMKSPTGAGIMMSEEYTPGALGEPGYFNNEAEITASINKKIKLIESPGIDSIILDSGNNSTITLSNDPKAESLAHGSVQIETLGPQKYLNTGSQTDLVVGEGGRELQLLNKGNGVAWGDGAICGNVNIQSYKKDVNIFTQAEEGRIFIECLNGGGSNQVIEIQTNGEGGAIRIKTNGKVDIEASEVGVQANSIDVKANTAINMDAPTINLNGVVNAPLVNAAFNGNITGTAGYAVTAGLAVVGTPIVVTVPAPVVPPADPGIGNTESYYGNDGVTTY